MRSAPSRGKERKAQRYLGCCRRLPRKVSALNILKIEISVCFRSAVSPKVGEIAALGRMHIKISQLQEQSKELSK